MCLVIHRRPTLFHVNRSLSSTVVVVNPGFEMGMEMRGMLRVFFWSKTEASAPLQCSVSNSRGF